MNRSPGLALFMAYRSSDEDSRILFARAGLRVAVLPLGRGFTAVELVQTCGGGQDALVLEIDDVERMTSVLQRWAALERQLRNF